MSWLIKNWGKDKYGLWTTISDGYLHIPKKLTREQIIEFIIREYKEEFKEKVDKLKKTFPNGWADKDTYKRIEDKRYMSEAEWHKEQYNKMLKK